MNPASLELHFGYSDRRDFLWRADFGRGCALFESNLGGGRQSLPMAVGLLSTEAALGEAIFF